MTLHLKTSLVHFFFYDFFMVSNENLDLICYREPIGMGFFAQKGHFLILSKNFTHFSPWPWKIEKSPKIILFASRMSWNLVRMKFALILCVESCQTRKKCLVTLFSDFSPFFQACPIKALPAAWNRVFAPDSGSLVQIMKLETIKKPC